ncbi:hypothetical protein NEIMUCOT_05664 [Neisseria mucosa ATCC 25996]|uniref:Uncharacterized protein n=1 Tax=Neisseria mucosa (strain ATCC 25996 / DSM 4631 / NCTC 10774 / M26) TaxID=546266 RepID=D2ZYF5_NEIM2|nr:hypothetical protein NEIMUCOT_05664 [Neisseria mucosa ATCC 25996]
MICLNQQQDRLKTKIQVSDDLCRLKASDFDKIHGLLTTYPQFKPNSNSIKPNLIR